MTMHNENAIYRGSNDLVVSEKFVSQYGAQAAACHAINARITSFDAWVYLRGFAQVDCGRWLPLRLASQHGYTDVVKVILDMDRVPDTQVLEESLEKAFAGGHWQIVKLILAFGRRHHLNSLSYTWDLHSLGDALDEATAMDISP
jgi:hypothetical protein